MAKTADKDVTTVRASQEIDLTLNSINMVDPEVLAGIENFDDAAAFIAEANDGIVAAHEELGDGTEIYNGDEKVKLVDVPMVFAEWKFSEGDKGRFVSIRAIARNEDGTIRRIVINDGSVGIMEQLAKYQKETQRVGGLMVRRGLRKSHYEYTPGKWATTFYINTSA